MTTEELRAKWVAALRSGHYKQGRRRLRGENDEFCCLGVLCDVYDPSQWDADDVGRIYMKTNYADLPGCVREACGLDLMTEQQLIVMNDMCVDFTTIADYLETLP